MALSLSAHIEQVIVWERLFLYNRGLPCGAQAIRLRLIRLGIQPLPSVSTIHRVLSRHGFTHRHTGFYPPSAPVKTPLPPVGLS